MAESAPRAGGGRWTVWAVAAAVIAAAALFAVRGPVRAMEPAPPPRGGSYDFVWMYSAARAWARGDNPYDIAAADAAFVAGGGPEDALRFRPGAREAGRSGLIYPPTTFVVIAPVALLPWEAARAMWAALGVGLYLGAVWALVRLCGWGWRGERGWLFVAVALALGPAHTAIAFGQTTAVAVGLVMLGVAARASGRMAAAGALLALACAIKPQLAGLFVVYEAAMGRWRIVGWAAGVGAVIAGIGAGMLWGQGIDWIGELRSNLRAFVVSGVGAPTRENPLRFQLLNLQYPLNELLRGPMLAQVLTFVAAGALIGAWVYARRRIARDGRAWSTEHDLLSLALVSALSLMAVYHRFYDAALLLPAAAWVVYAWGSRPWPALAGVSLGVAAFFVNATGPLYHYSKPGEPLARFAHNYAWDTIVMPHEAWAILLMAVVAAGALVREARRPGERRSG